MATGSRTPPENTEMEEELTMKRGIWNGCVASLIGWLLTLVVSNAADGDPFALYRHIATLSANGMREGVRLGGTTEQKNKLNVKSLQDALHNEAFTFAICTLGECTSSNDCTSDNDCTSNTHGCTANIVCTQGKQCTNGGQCTAGEACTAGEGCTSSAQCTAGDGCTRGAACTRSDRCTHGDSCTNGKRCTQSNNCTGGKGCTQGSDCTGGKTCTGTDHDSYCTAGRDCTHGPNCTKGTECTKGPRCTKGPGCNWDPSHPSTHSLEYLPFFLVTFLSTLYTVRLPSCRKIR